MVRFHRLPALIVLLCLIPCLLWGDGPTPPETLSVTVGVMWADLVWRDESGQAFFEGYKVYRRVVAEEEEAEVHPLGDYDLIAQSPGAGNWYHDIDVSAGTRYAYVITVYRTAAAVPPGEESAPCEEGLTDHEIWESIYGGGPGVEDLGPDPPDGLGVTIGVGWADLTWDPNNELDLYGYVVYRRIVSEGAEGDEHDRQLSDYDAIAVGGQESYHDTDVREGIEYAYAITAVDNVENESAPCEEVTTGAMWGGGGGGGGGCFLSAVR